ncbi:ShlB/FhaC/HecB family hemolysin secretion/activation protein [Microbulbifer sp. OS29]|uniref:ShlB/FhaC/HecB family hemolysin secretion/activation protein n=1 Tax=Microbulbifer okhotskensis TaxID=2926617 RepID=A0A9X2ENP3_9GAMM|nr:ShlB/FhaC/HecB family hemolysin secretion/activation protein [Microbulbifer okhotskensis]MCO1332918.1 ShlB/FhaC/HecB family hemolysin secretion/activation protein [Microbulbifer okhotskensis]
MLGLEKRKLALFLGAGFLVSQVQVFAQDEGSSFRSLVREAFDQNTPTVNEVDVTKDFLQRTYEAEDPNLNTEIPEISQRNQGPRITVKEFIFHRLEEYPEFGISREAVEEMAEDLRVKFMKEDKILASGYTVENLEELAVLLDGMNAQFKPGGLGPAELKKLVNIIEKQNKERGLSYGDLEEIAADLTSFYRRQGLFLAQVQIPAQDVENGVVTLTVQEGLLGQIAAEDNDVYTEAKLAEPFESQRGQLVNHENIEEGLYLLNDLPGLNVTGYFSAGDNPGETKLNLKVRESDSWRATFRADNHGSLYTGSERVYATVDWLNPLGFGDALTLGYLKSNPESDDDFGSDLGQFRYSFPLFGPRTRLEISADHNEFELYNEDDEGDVVNLLEISGVNKSYAVSLDHKFRRSRDFNFTGSFGFTEKKSDLEGIIEFTNDHVYGGEVGVYMDSLSNGFLSMLNILSATVQYGEHQNTVEEGRGDDFNKVAINTSSLIFLPMPFVDDHSRLIMKGRAQFSESNLPGFEQLSLGGANGVRAFSARDFSADIGAVLSAEWYVNFPEFMNPVLFDQRLNDIFQVALIADVGYGFVNNYEEAVEDDWARLSGGGMLFKMNWSDSFSSKVSVAWPIMSSSSIVNTAVGEDEPTVYADFSIFYN